MEDVKVQTDNRIIEKIVKTNTTKISKISNNNVRKPKCKELDKFKRRLIRAIARLLYTENKTEADVWDDLKNETGCDCELLWSRMRALTIKKLFRLFTAEDKIENITKIAQLSVTDWLLYDLVLVHEKVDVIGQELVIKEEPTFLRDLFDVVVEFNIENETSDSLSKKWFDATAKYNNTGKRQCSPMLLQKRWYQLKERSRSNFYNFWFQYRGDSKKLEKANEFKPSDLQLDIVKRYKEIVTMPFLSWEDLIKEGKVVLPEDFERLRLARNKITISENEPDLQLIEPHLETIDLDENIDSDDSVNKDTDNKKEFSDFNIDIVKIESLAEENDDVSVLESVHIPLEKFESSEINNSDIDDETTKDPDDYDLEVIDSDSEQIMPRIASVTSTAYLESAKDNDESIPKDIIDIEDSETRMNSTKAVNIILEEIVKNVVNNKVNANFDSKLDTINKEKFLNLDKDIDKEEVEKPVTTQNSEETYDINNDIGFDEFSSNFNFIDNGIEFVDDGIEYMDEDCTHEYNMQSETKSEINEATNEEESKIDLKLLLSPVCYTKKLDDMDVFRFIDYNSIKDGRVLENAFLESKPKDKKSINMKEMFQECNADNTDNTSNIKSDSDDVLPDNDVTISSWLFRKPKVSNYNPIQLCKNPDFNTRLKRLGAAFYTSQRNRLQLKECKPLTVDLHKTFESKLINNTLNLKKNKNYSDVEINVHETIATSCKLELPETIESRHDNEIAANHQIQTIKTSEVHTERNKVINLPDINQIRRVNQGLQVAEVSPIQISNLVTIETNIKPQNNLLNTVIEPVNQYIDSEATTDKAITETPASQYSIQADKVIGISDNENTKAVNLEENIKVDNEESKIVSLKNFEIDSAKSYKCYSRNPLTKQPFPKLKTKTFTKKYMELSWLPKPQATRIDVSDCLLAADTVERILSLCKNDYVSVNPKVYKPKRKKKNGVTDKNKTVNQPPTSPQNISIQENKTQKEIEKPKKTKLRISITSQTTNVKNICCWARHKIQNLYKRTKAKHFCSYDRCVCCCKDELEEKIVAIEEQRKRCEFIVLSDDESTVTAKKQYPVSKVTIGTNTDYDKDFEDQFAANLSLFKDNANKGYIPILSLPFGAVKQTYSNENGCQTPSPNRIEKPLLSSITDKIIDNTNTQKNKPKIPISLGKNKILLCSFKPTTKAVSTQKVNKRYQNNLSERILPEGCHLVLLPNRELALSIDPGVELDANELSKLPPLIASVQKQINIIPTLENVLEPSNAVLNEETVIHLSDDENSDMKGNNNISPTETHIENSIASIVIDLKPIGTITNVDKRISDSELNSPKESCQNINPVTKNSTATDIEKNVIIESSTNEIISEDNITDEVINNSINNNDDASGVNKKTILSDLMQMSGISTDDINVGNNDVNVDSNDIGVAHNLNDVTNAGSISIIPQVLTQSDSFTSDLQRQYANITRILGIKPINNLIVKAALIRCPEINVVSTFLELKFAYENGAHFFKMDIEDGIIVPINVCIKKNMEQIRIKDAKDLSKAPKSIIDLTEDNEIDSSNIRPIQQRNKQEINDSCDVTIPKIQDSKNKGSIKPIKMFKAIQPSILRYSGRSLLVRPMTDSTMRQNKIIGLTKHKRKQRLCAKNVDLEVDNIVKSQNNPSDNILSDGESDEEPLAKKAKRLKDNLEREVKNNIDYQPLDVNNKINSEKSAQIDVNYDLPIRLEPYVFDENHGQSSDEDCILGV